MKNYISVIFADNQNLTAISIHYHFLQREWDSSCYCFLDARNKEDLERELFSFPDALVVLDYSLFDFADAKELIDFCKRFPLAHFLLFLEEIVNNDFGLIIGSENNFSILLKHCSEEEIVSAIDTVVAGERFVCDDVIHRIAKNRVRVIVPVEDDGKRLTSNELIIFKQFLLGFTSKEVAMRRNLSTHTVVTHRKNIFRKLGVSSLQEAIRYALSKGIISVDDYSINV